MWIVRVALRHPYTFVVLAMLIVLFGGYAIINTAVDIFPNIRIPVVASIWRYNGLPAEDMANRIVLFAERTAQTVVNDVEHTESQSVNGNAVVKYFFQPTVDEDLAYGQITGVSQTQLASAPPGTTPPFILAYNASSVPIIQMAMSSDTLSEARINDISNNLIRTALSTVAGASMPFPYGGKQRQVQVDLNPKALRANGLSATDVTAAIGAQNLILPAGSQKIGSLEYFIKLNASTNKIDELNDLPIRTVNGRVIYVRDVAHVRDGNSPQNNIVRLDGHRAILMSVLKTGTTSTLDIIKNLKQKLPEVRDIVPPELKIQTLGDQSIFVRAAVTGVIREGVIAAALTGLMIMLFLGSWRSTLIITISIPLSILASIACLSALGETINIMTLGGLALAVGILVDDATVTIENINWHLEQGKDVEQAILDGAHQIALPALVSTLAICIVFIPMFFLAGIAKFLFVPLAEAVVFAMLALKSGPRFAGLFLLAMAATALIAFPIGPLPGLGQDFFPSVDAGQIKLHVRARSGTRIEETAALCDQVEATIRATIPHDQLVNIVDNIGLPYSGINLAYSTSAPVGPGDADIFVSLVEGHHPTAGYVKELRSKLTATYPSTTFSFLPADIVSQILNFGLPAALDVQISGFNVAGNHDYAVALLQKLRNIPGAVDMRVHQSFDYPQINVDVDRSKAQLLGLTQQNVASNMLVSLSGSFQTSPSFWIDPKTGTQYNVATQTPQSSLQTLNDLATTPLSAANGAPSQMLANVATFRRSFGPTTVSHYNATPAIDIYGSVEGMDLGYVAKSVERILAETSKDLPKGSHAVLRGQAQTMKASFNGLLFGLVGAIILVYLLIVVNFQSWLDPLIIISALPAALAGIVWMLFLTGTSVSVPALTGAIMCMGVATANSVLVVSFARERMDAGESAFNAALQAGYSRLRPVLMTALAMIVGMLPMALGMGEGGEQNAPLGRAVIGGLIFATIATLLFVPTVFKLIHGRNEAHA